MRRDHTDRCSNPDSIIDRGKQKCLRSASGFTGARNATWIDIGKRGQEIDRSDCIPELQTQQVESPERLALSTEAMTDGRAVIVSDHVESKCDIALLRKICRTERSGICRGVLDSAVGPMTVRTKNRWSLAAQIFRPVKVPGYVVATQTLEIYLFDRVGAVVCEAENMSAEIRLRWFRPEPGAYENLATKLPGAHKPLIS